MIKNEKIFITGGAGFLGKTLIKKLSKDNEITIYSRDEFKHYLLKKYYPNVEFIVGDIRNYDLLQRSSRDHSIGIFAASLKQIEACENNAEEASRIIVDGALNCRRVLYYSFFSVISRNKTNSSYIWKCTEFNRKHNPIDVVFYKRGQGNAAIW